MRVPRARTSSRVPQRLGGGGTAEPPERSGKKKRTDRRGDMQPRGIWVVILQTCRQSQKDEEGKNKEITRRTKAPYSVYLYTLTVRWERRVRRINQLLPFHRLSPSLRHSSRSRDTHTTVYWLGWPAAPAGGCVVTRNAVQRHTRRRPLVKVQIKTLWYRKK